VILSDLIESIKAV